MLGQIGLDDTGELIGGKIRPSAKSDLLHCLGLKEKQLLQAPVVNAKFLHGATVVQMLNPGLTLFGMCM